MIPSPVDFSTRYLAELHSLLDRIEITLPGTGERLSYADGILKAVEMIREAEVCGTKIMMMGNGGSAGICSHLTIDFWKNANVKAMTFSDPSLLTCLANDYSYAEAFAKCVERFGDARDVAICISSSGGSANILNAAVMAGQKGCRVITLSGFKADNPLRSLGDLHIYVPSYSYGMVENIHQIVIHQILDTKLQCFDRKDIFNKNLPY